VAEVNPIRIALLCALLLRRLCSVPGQPRTVCATMITSRAAHEAYEASDYAKAARLLQLPSKLQSARRRNPFALAKTTTNPAL